MFFHHRELVVAADSEVWSAYTYYAVVGQIGILFGDYPHTSHFFSPVVDGGVAPEAFVVVVTKQSKLTIRTQPMLLKLRVFVSTHHIILFSMCVFKQKRNHSH